MILTEMLSRLRAAREAAGLTQAELAAGARVSRSLVAAVEGGRHTPAVDAALRLAALLGVTLESLFDGSSERAVPVLETLPAGSPVRAARVGEQLVYAPLSAAAALAEPADAELGLHGELRFFGQDESP